MISFCTAFAATCWIAASITVTMFMLVFVHIQWGGRRLKEFIDRLWWVWVIATATWFMVAMLAKTTFNCFGLGIACQ